MNIAQMELSLNNPQPRTGAALARRPRSRAQWWFARMRQVVERARDWQPAPPARPEQTWLPGALRLMENRVAGEQRQLCE